jgi:(2Fe-2S) ferredoxin
VIVCRGPVCRDQRGSDQLREHLAQTIEKRGLQDRIRLADEVCLGHCLRGPNILVHDEDDPRPSYYGVMYNRMTIEDLERVVDRHLMGGIVVRALTNLPAHKWEP